MTPDTSKARNLIEEAIEEMAWLPRAAKSNVVAISVAKGIEKLTEALTLLPEWQEFDGEREETWPKDNDEYFDQNFMRRRWYKDHKNDIMWAWKVDKVQTYIKISSIAPPPYVKK